MVKPYISFEDRQAIYEGSLYGSLVEIDFRCKISAREVYRNRVEMMIVYGCICVFFIVVKMLF